MKVKIRQNESVLLEVRIVIILGGGGLLDPGNVPFLELGASYT